MDYALQIVAFENYLPLRCMAVLLLVSFLVLRRKKPAEKFEAQFVGNLTNHIYHLKTCQYGSRIGQANRRDIYNHLAATSYGFRPCKECIGYLTEEEFVDGGGMAMISVDDPEAAKAYFEAKLTDESQHPVRVPPSRARIS